MKRCFFLNHFISIVLLLLIKRSFAEVVCPKSSDYFPCKCEPELFFSNGTLLELNCRDKNLNDSRISDILDAFLSAPEVTSLVILNLGNNQLTRVPDQVRRFDRLQSIYLEKNIINNVHSGAFVFPIESSNQQRVEIRLNQNQVSQVEPGAFEVGRRYHIHLGKNKLTRLEAGAFQSVLEQIMAETVEDNIENRMGIYDNQIDCESDPCHLAWLVRWQTPVEEGHKHRLLEFVQHAECSNGTRMEELDPNAFIECAVHRENNLNATVSSEPVSSVSSAINNNTSVKPVHELPPSVVCPKPQLYSPCECSAREDGLTSKLDCSNKGLDDQMISDILSAFISDDSGLFLGHLDLKDNQLSHIPHQVKLFKQLAIVDIDQDNIPTTESIVENLSVMAESATIDNLPQTTELMGEWTSPSNSDGSVTELPSTIYYPNLSQTSNGDDDDASKFISGVSRLFQHFQSLSSNVSLATNVPNVTLPTFRTSLIPQDTQALDNTNDMALTSSICLWFGEVLPCKCTPNYDSDGALVGLNCRNSSLTDSSMNEILDALLAKPNATSLSHLHLSENNLTRVPDQVKRFTQLKSVDLSDNRIVTIQSGTFVSHQQQMMIFLNGNQISRIEPEAFQGGNFLISLENNNLTRFDANTFKLMLERMKKNRKSSSDILLEISNNKIDCESDPCHLSWILRDDRNLIDLISNDSMCSNNTRLKDLSQDAFISCPGGKPTGNYSTVNSSTFLCPKAENVSPCLCMHNEEDNTAFLFCEERNLDDDKASKILDAFLTTPGVNPLGIVLFSSNQLTRIPDQLRHFTKLSNVELNNNKISSIEPGTFVFDKMENNNTIYSLNNNKLNRLDVEVFHALFKGMNLFDNGPHVFISIDKNPIDCKSDPCHLSWLIRENRQALNFIKDGQCSNGTRLEDLNPIALINCPNQLRINLNLPATSTKSPANRMINSASFSSWIVCPKPSDYWPCVCDKIIAGVNPDTVRLSCNRKNLTDSRVSEILDAFLSTPGISPLSHLNLTDNRLTRVPNQVKLFERLYVVHLQNNSIETVQSGAFMSTRGGKDRLNVYLTDNKISLIEPGAFQGENYSVDLRGNQLTRFDENVFKPILERMISSNSSYPVAIDISGNPINCDGDPCHLAWLVRDYQLLSHVKLGYCYNTRFDKIDRSALNNCSDS